MLTIARFEPTHTSIAAATVAILAVVIEIRVGTGIPAAGLVPHVELTAGLVALTGGLWGFRPSRLWPEGFVAVVPLVIGGACAGFSLMPGFSR